MTYEEIKVLPQGTLLQVEFPEFIMCLPLLGVDLTDEYKQDGLSICCSITPEGFAKIMKLRAETRAWSSTHKIVPWDIKNISDMQPWLEQSNLNFDITKVQQCVWVAPYKVWGVGTELEEAINKIIKEVGL
jgi:hypothetical protein